MNRCRSSVRPLFVVGLFFLAIVGKPFSASAVPSSRPGWGSIPYSGGVTFRVWAPHASSVTVPGQFNSFSTTATPLFSEGTSGVWSVDVPGATAGQQYKYFLNGSTYKQDPRCRQEISQSGNSIIYNTTNFNWTGDTFSTPALSDTVVYEMHIGSFYDPSSPGSPGTFINATNKLAFLKQLGVSAVEVMPINEFPGNFNWGYNPDDLFGVESSYGGPDAFKNFVKTAHQLGIAVLVDVVHNHYGDNGGSSGDLAYGLWDFDGYDGGLNGGGIYFNQTNGWCCTPWGPRPNASSTQVRNFIRDSIAMWLSECHVDGFRWDAPYDFMNASDAGTNIFIADVQSLLQQISSLIHTGYVGKINIGENSGYLSGTAGFDSTWYSSPFQNNLVSQLTVTNDSARNMSAIDSAVNINHNGQGASGWGNVVFTDTHDSAGDLNGGQRMPVLIASAAPTGWYARKLSTLGAAVTLTTAGIPMILQGAELLTTAQFGASNPLDWSRTNTYSGIVSLYQDLIHLRRNLDGRSSGLKGLNTSTIQRDNSNRLIAYRRWNTGNVGDDVIVICNFANTNWPAYNISGFPHTGIWYTQLNSDFTKYGSDYGNYGSLSTTVAVNTATISIAPYSVLIMSQNIPGAPPTPQGLTTTTGGTNQINLAWSASGGATGYIVKRGGSQIATTAATTYSDTGLSSGVNYCYTVAATNNLGGTSADSASACAITLPATSATNLLAYWTFDEGTGSTAFDSSGNTNTGTVVLGSGAWTGGMINGALSFDGFSTQVTVSNAASLNPVNGITLAAWINSPDWFNSPRFIEKGASFNQYGLCITNTGQLQFFLSGVANGSVVATPPSNGAWHHIAGTYDGSLISLYIDGQLVAQQPAGGPLAVTTDSLAIGNRPGGGVVYKTDAILDDVRIYGSALSANQIAQVYGADSVGDGIANWWRLQYFGSSSTTGATTCASCDFDNTGQNNLFKYVAGLNPTDPTSVFFLQIASDTNQTSQQNLLFDPLATGRTYTPQFSTDLVGGVWLPLPAYSGPLTNGNQVTITDTNAVPPQKFYRIDISYP
ncbi:MAG TPA: LamG-like jellyroll fold domain-containing protein [Verrucomicrobiae bacterium]|nr:LamG-like jellyroll fold domain-containing protein [Verrucomicrobiae bacterium]